MKHYHLNYYPQFNCIADKCKHTCCAGWKVLIDAKTLANYKKEQSDFSATLKKGVDFKRACFKLDKSGRCAFLNDGGLCEIIINIGEQSLCQVCRDHPRFRNFFAHATETGLGFCCEQATRVIFGFNDKIAPVLDTDCTLELVDNGCCNTPAFVLEQVLNFRSQALNIIQDRSTPIDDRINNLLALCSADFKGQYFKKIVGALLGLERLDKVWSKRLKCIKNLSFSTVTHTNLSHFAEQFLANSFYRHLADAEDVFNVRARALACVFAWWVIKSIIGVECIQTLGCNLDSATKRQADFFELVVDIVRGYSADVEYSEKNLNKLFAFACRYVKI